MAKSPSRHQFVTDSVSEFFSGRVLLFLVLSFDEFLQSLFQKLIQLPSTLKCSVETCSRISDHLVECNNRGGTCPPDVADLGEEVWNAAGIKILGTPIGSPEFVHSTVQQRLEDEGRFWQAIGWVPDLQCAVAAPPAMRRASLPSPPSDTPSQPGNRVCSGARRRHVAGDERLDEGPHGDRAGKDDCTPTGDTPHAPRRTWVEMRDTAPAAFRSSWADALQMIHQRLPGVLGRGMEALHVRSHAVGT